MHEGDMSAGFDETATAEKSVAQNVRGALRLSEAGTYMRMRGNQTDQYREQGSSRRSRTVCGCSRRLTPTCVNKKVNGINSSHTHRNSTPKDSDCPIINLRFNTGSDEKSTHWSCRATHFSQTLQCFDLSGRFAIQVTQKVWPFNLPSEARSSIIFQV